MVWLNLTRERKFFITNENLGLVNKLSNVSNMVWTGCVFFGVYNLKTKHWCVDTRVTNGHVYPNKIVLDIGDLMSQPVERLARVRFAMILRYLLL